jgi:predicted  nucleic acid-binding Zn ribbon protein
MSSRACPNKILSAAYKGMIHQHNTSISMLGRHREHELQASVYIDIYIYIYIYIHTHISYIASRACPNMPMRGMNKEMTHDTALASACLDGTAHMSCRHRHVDAHMHTHINAYIIASRACPNKILSAAYKGMIHQHNTSISMLGRHREHELQASVYIDIYIYIYIFIRIYHI